MYMFWQNEIVLKIFMCLLFFTGWLLQYLWGYWLERNTSYLFYMQRKPWTYVIISYMQFFFFFTYFPSFQCFWYLVSFYFQTISVIAWNFIPFKFQHIGSVSLANPRVSQLHNVKRMRVLAQGLLRCINLAKLWKWSHFQRMKSWDSLLLQQVNMLLAHCLKVRIFLNLSCHPYSSISS